MKQLSTAFLFLVLAACAQLGLAPADTFEKKLAYAYGTYTAVQQSAASALTAKEITKDDAVQVLALGDQARALLDAARVIGDPTEAQSKLLLATQILQQLQMYLQQHRSK